MDNDETSILEEPMETLPAIREITPSEITPYHGISSKRVTQDQEAILTEPVKDQDLDILPTGEIYLSQVGYRRRLNKAFGPGGWALMPTSPIKMHDNTVCQEYSLFAEGRFISKSIGEQEYQPDNKRMSYATATEGAKSNALMRCCKDLLIASECWDKRFCEKFKASHCIQVWVKDKTRPQWRLKTADPFYGESGLVKKDEVKGTQSPQTVQADKKAAHDTAEKAPKSVSEPRSPSEPTKDAFLPAGQGGLDSNPELLKAQIEAKLMKLEGLAQVHWQELLKQHSKYEKNGKVYQATTMTEIMRSNKEGKYAWAYSTYGRIKKALEEAEAKMVEGPNG